MTKPLYLLLLFSVINVFSQDKMSVYFDFNTTKTTAVSTRELSDWIRKNKTAEILKIYGYCDSVGSLIYNDTLALKRANSVLQTLKNNSITLTQNLEVKSFGKRFEQSSVQADNRRVEIYYQNKAESLSAQIAQLKVGEKLRFRNLNFYNASGKIVPKSEPVLADLVLVMKQNPKLKIKIEGHICCEWNDDIGISFLRSKTVYDYLIKNGIDKNRLSYIGYGSMKPIYPLPENNDFERNENRRVEVKIIEN